MSNVFVIDAPDGEERASTLAAIRDLLSCGAESLKCTPVTSAFSASRIENVPLAGIVLTELLLLAEASPQAESDSGTLSRLSKDASQVFAAVVSGTHASGEVVRHSSMSPNHYAESLFAITRTRISLATMLAAWLDSASAVLQAPVVVCFLSDLELCNRARVEEFVTALIDELHQHRLLFVLGADLDLVARRFGDLDEVFAREILYKVAPMPHRFKLGGPGILPGAAVEVAAAPAADVASALLALMTSLFDYHELCGLARQLGGGIVDLLPIGAGLSATASCLIDALMRRGMVDADLFDALRTLRPKRTSQIESVERLFV